MTTRRAGVVAATTAAVAMLAMAATGAQSPSGGRSVSGPISMTQARDAVDQIARDVHEARTLASVIAERNVRDRIEQLLATAEHHALALKAELSKPPAAPAGPAILSDEEFAKLLKGVKGQPFDKDKVIFIQNFGTTRPLTCAQLVELLRTFSFDDDRVKAVALLYPKLVDRLDFPTVLDVFTFESGKKKAREAVGLK